LADGDQSYPQQNAPICNSELTRTCTKNDLRNGDLPDGIRTLCGHRKVGLQRFAANCNALGGLNSRSESRARESLLGNPICRQEVNSAPLLNPHCRW